jgi:hypothetical protein
MTNVYQGDPTKVITAEGSTLAFTGGQPAMCSDYVNAIKFSLFVVDWVGNLFFSGDEILKSDFEMLHDETITLTKLLDIEDSARTSLQWLVSKGIFSKMSVSTQLSQDINVVTILDIILPEGLEVKYTITRTPSEWLFEGK